jgi:hypothetical protein
MLYEFASRFYFSKKVFRYKPRQFRFLVVRGSQPTWQGHWTTPVGQTFTHTSQVKTTRRSANMAKGIKIQQTDWYYFSILSNSYFIKFIPRSNIYRDMGVAVFSSGLHG